MDDSLWSLSDFDLSNEVFSNFDDMDAKNITEMVIRVLIQSGQGSDIYSSLVGSDDEYGDENEDYEVYPE